MALVVVLSVLVLLSVLLLALLSSATLNRQSSVGSLTQAQTDFLSRTAIETIIGDLRGEIAAGSDSLVPSEGDQPLYRPKEPSNIRPSRTVDGALTNLVKISSAESAAWLPVSGASFSDNGPIRAISGNSTIKRSANARFIPEDRWATPKLVGVADFASLWKNPDWILITRDGPIENALDAPSLADLSDFSSPNRNYAIGRFAYVVYDVGGLIDVNVAGNLLTEAHARLKGRLPTAELDQIPGFTNPVDFIKWRWPVTGANAGINANGLFDPLRRFDKVVPGYSAEGASEQLLLNRQELLAYQKNHPSEINESALPYLTVFSREKNAPSFDAVGPANPDILEIRWKSDKTLPDGTIVQKGDVVFGQRFPLSRLGLILPSSVATANNAADAIYRNFGLYRSANSQPWTYDHGAANKILGLSEVEALGRSPDFFETLKIGILAGSLGKTAFPVGSTAPLVKSQSRDAVSDLQIIQIGANLIDQYDTDNLPTTIHFTNPLTSTIAEIAGVEDLPYLYGFNIYYYRPETGNNTTRDTIGNWFVPVIWNPHRTSTSSSESPTAFRIRLSTGQVRALIGRQPMGTNELKFGIPQDYSASNPIITYSTSSLNYRQPAELKTSDGAASTGMNQIDDPNGNKILGFFAGSIEQPDRRLTGNLAHFQWTHAAPSFLGPPVTVNLEYFADGTWHPYQKLENMQTQALMWSAPSAAGAYTSPVHISQLLKPDPRGNRFGLFASDSPVSGTIRPSRSNSGVKSSYGTPSTPEFINSEPVTSWGQVVGRMGTLAENSAEAGVTPYSIYADPDGVVRPGDARYGGFPQASGSDTDTDARPIILNRPFRTVGEMGYAFRDLPWKTLDFFSDLSADSALLDLFSVDDNAMLAGKVDLNTPHREVLQGLLAGVGLRLAPGMSDVLDVPDAEEIASYIVAERPFTNISELPAKLSQADGGFPVDGDIGRLKEQRESITRALASSTQTRTWNLMIDVICQAGRYPKTASDLDQFVVEGEQRYWVHIAIDRFTGEIVDKIAERVQD